jgi:hypothetical protein
LSSSLRTARIVSMPDLLPIFVAIA